MAELRYSIETSAHLLRTALADQPGEPVVQVSREALETVLAAYDAGIAEGQRITKEWEDHTRPGILSWYDRDPQEQNLSQRDDAAREILEALTGRQW